MQLHPYVEPAGQRRRSGGGKRIALLVVGDAIDSHPRPFIIEWRGLQLAIANQRDPGAMSNRHARRYGPEPGELRQDTAQPALDPRGIEVETVAAADPVVRMHPSR